jgi:tetratricopeptide (TPR) repeat protein/tRNA A-37 threonylcarbamoyl transferase component Bud32
MAAESFGKYRVLQRLGRGGMAEVYQATHPDLKRHVAIKVIYPHLAADEGFGARFRREARVAASLRHPHVVQLYDFDLQDGQPFMVMEHLPGGTLKERLSDYRARGESLRLEEISRLLAPLADALDYAHQRGMVHRDIKPANILFTERGEPVLSDFGIAKILSDTAQLSVTRGILGTPAYMSPEQATGQEVDARSDLYSLAVVLYEMLTGQVPFRGDSPTTVMMKHVSEPPPPPSVYNPAIPEAVDAVVLKALAKAPAARFSSASALARAYDAASMSSTAETDPALDSDAPTLLDAGQTGAATVVERPAESSLAVVPTPEPEDIHGKRRLMVPGGLALLGIGAALVYAAGTGMNASWPLGTALPWLALFLLATAALATARVGWQAPSRVERLQAAGMLVLMLALASAGGAWLATSRPTVADSVVVAVSQFDGREATQRVDFGRRIFEQLEGELSEYDTPISIIRTNEVYTDREQARAAGLQRAATLVIWGWYDDAGVSPHLEVVHHPPPGREMPVLVSHAHASSHGGRGGPALPDLAEVTRAIRLPATMPALDLFVEAGPQQIVAVSAAVLGISFYLGGDLDSALALLDRALEVNQQGDVVEGQAAIHFYRAATLYQRGQLADAIAGWEEAVQLAPDLGEAYHNLALAYAEGCEPTARVSRALEAAEQAARVMPDDSGTQLLLGSLYLQAGQLMQAHSAVESARSLAPDNPSAYSLLAQIHTAEGDEAEAETARLQAVELAEAAASRRPDSVDAQLLLGDSLVAAGEYDRALEAYQAVSQLDPSSGGALWGIGNVHYWRGEFELAEQAYTRWAELEPGNGTPFLLLGLLLAEQERTEDAVAMLQRAAEKAPCDPSVPLVLGGLYATSGEYEQAIPAYEQAVSLDPQNADALYVLGTMYYLTDRLPDAGAALEQAVDADPRLAEAYNALAQVRSDEGDYEAAVTAWEQAIEEAPDEPAYYVALAGGLEKLGRLPIAQAAYEQALALKDDANTRVYLALALQQQGRLDDAISELQRALALDATNDLAYSGLGDIYLQQGRLEEAEVAYRAALARQESSPVHAQLARVYELLGRPDEAVQEIRQAINLDPEDEWAYVQLASLLASAGELDAAAEHYATASELAPELPNPYAGLALVEYKRCRLPAMEQAIMQALHLAPEVTLYRALRGSVAAAQGRAEDASRAYAELQSAPEEDGLAHLFAGEFLLQAGNLPEARAELEKAIASEALVPAVLSAAHTSLGQLFYEQDDLMGAEEQWNLALDLFPANAVARMWLGNLALRQGQAERALAEYDTAVELLPTYGQQFSADQVALLEVGLALRRALALGEAQVAAEAFDDALEGALALAEASPQWPQANLTLAVVRMARGEGEAAEAVFAAAIQCDQSLHTARERAEAELARLRGR